MLSRFPLCFHLYLTIKVILNGVVGLPQQLASFVLSVEVNAFSGMAENLAVAETPEPLPSLQFPDLDFEIPDLFLESDRINLV